jgi:hypothetical protein
MSGEYYGLALQGLNMQSVQGKLEAKPMSKVAV